MERKSRKKEDESIKIVNEMDESRKENYKPGFGGNRGSNKWLTCVLLIVITLILVFIAIGVYLVDNGKLNLFSSSNERVELQHTETNNKIKEGIYITDVSEVVENVMPSIVAITSKTLVSSGMFGFNYYGSERYSEGAGSGIIVSKNKSELLILTNNHVVDGTSELSVQFINNVSLDATIKGVSEKRDLAIISVKLKDLNEETLSAIKLATIGDSNELKVGNGVIAIGNALGYGQSVTTGVVSALNREITIDNYTNKMIQIDAAINGGNSGGALLNSKGEVVGINAAKYSSNSSNGQASVEGMGFAIPITDVTDLITSLMNGETPKEGNGAVLGVAGLITEESFGMPMGFYITEIVSGSGAEKAGLEIGNIISAIEGKTVTSLNILTEVLNEKNPGDKVTLTIKYVSGRNYKEKNVKVTLSDK